MIIVTTKAKDEQDSSIVFMDTGKKYTRKRSEDEAKKIFDLLGDVLPGGVYDELAKLFENDCIV